MKISNSLAFVMSGFCATLFLASCASEGDTVQAEASTTEVSTNVLPENHNPIALKVGDSWTYRLMDIDNGARRYTGESDTTMTQWHSFRLTKDTVIGGLPFSLVEEVRKKKNGDDSLIPGGMRSAIYNDSLGVTEVSLDDVDLNVFARRQSVGDSLLNAKTHVYDVIVPIVFPLVKGDTFSFRPKLMSGRTDELKQVYLGQCEIQTRGGLKPTWKFVTVYSDSAVASMFRNVETWIGVNGLLHKQGTINSVLVNDSLGGTHYVQRTVIKDYWGTDILPVDSLNSLFFSSGNLEK